MDPRNFLTEQYIFQFEHLTYIDTYHSRDAVQNILDSTFVKEILPGADKLYFQFGAECVAMMKCVITL